MSFAFARLPFLLQVEILKFSGARTAHTAVLSRSWRHAVGCAVRATSTFFDHSFELCIRIGKGTLGSGVKAETTILVFRPADKRTRFESSCSVRWVLSTHSALP